MSHDLVGQIVILADPKTGRVIASGLVVDETADHEGLHWTVQTRRSPETPHTTRRRRERGAKP